MAQEAFADKPLDVTAASITPYCIVHCCCAPPSAVLLLSIESWARDSAHAPRVPWMRRSCSW
eukprot:COSAG05_NODE_226_length_13453_cov_12.522315_10_plen_62_part_00